MLGTTATVISASIEYIRVYSAIAVSVYINIVYKQITNMVKDVWVIDYWLNKFKDSLSEIKDKLVFLRRGIIALVRNARLLDIEYK